MNKTREKIKRIVDATSAEHVAQQVPISPSTLYEFLNGKSVSKRMITRLQLFAQRYGGESKNKLKVPLITELSSYQQMHNVLRLTEEDNTIGIITGRAGIGKTTALKSYANDNPCIYMSACSNTSATAIAREIGAYFGLYKNGSLSLITASIAQELRANDLMVMVDEACYLSDRALEWLRQIVHDQGGCGLVLAGLPRLIGRIHNLKADHDQLRSRVRYNLQLSGITHDDAMQVIKATWADLPKDVSNRILAIADYATRRGQDVSLRTITHLLISLKRTCRVLNKEPSVILVEDVTQSILK